MQSDKYPSFPRYTVNQLLMMPWAGSFGGSGFAARYTTLDEHGNHNSEKHTNGTTNSVQRDNDAS